MATGSYMTPIYSRSQKCQGEKKLSFQIPLDLLQNLSSESSVALTDDSSDEVPTDNLLKISSYSEKDDQETEQDEGTTDRRGRSHPPQCTISREDRQIVCKAVTDRSVTSRTIAQHIESATHHSVSARNIRRRLQQSALSARYPLLGIPLTQNHRVSSINGAMKEGCGRQNGMKLSLLTSHASVCNTTVVGFESGDTVERMHRREDQCSVMHRYTGHAPGIMVLDGIGYHSRTPLVRIAGTLNSQRYISEVLEPVVLPYLQGLAPAIFQQDNARPHVARIVDRFFVNHQIELLSWPVRSPDLSSIENMWSMVAQRLPRLHTPLPHQINFGNVWKLLGLLYPKNTSKASESMPRRMAAVISNNGGYSGY
ncbi:transposable element Tc1 transposase [Trichonephila clavipes]|nr:transposable element Tc1 transposase [Trichonephila clavipes]